MTRKEQIEQAIRERCRSSVAAVYFKCGAEWADAHQPSPWISVEEHPKKSGTYFVMKDAYWVDTAQFNISSKEWSNCENSRKITHWMLIPELQTTK